jgi:prepilin-type N-terminal cleavage/methylation domain-containing protein
MRRQHGFTLVEVMMALVVMLIVTGGLYKLLVTTQKLSRAQAEQSSLQSNVRSGALVVPNELRELNTVTGGTVDQNDIIALNANDITYRAMRGMGIICAAPAANQIRVYGTASATNPFSGYRDPAAGTDGLYVFSEGPDDLHAVDDSWIRRGITAVSKATACPQAGNPPGITLTLDAALPALPAVGMPVRTFEVMQLQLYVDAAGESYLGARSVNTAGSVMQPVLGPLTAGNGFQLAYWNANNAATGVKEDVKSITVTVRGLSDQLVNTGTGGGTMAYAHDSLATRVLLRNSIRP